MELRNESQEPELVERFENALSGLWAPSVGHPREDPQPGSVFMRAEVISEGC